MSLPPVLEQSIFGSIICRPCKLQLPFVHVKLSSININHFNNNVKRVFSREFLVCFQTIIGDFIAPSAQNTFAVESIRLKSEHESQTSRRHGTHLVRAPYKQQYSSDQAGEKVFKDLIPGTKAYKSDILG